MRARGIRRSAAALTGLALGALVAAAAYGFSNRAQERPANEVTKYVAQLRSAATLADQAASSTGWLVSHNAKRCPQVGPAAAKLAAAAGAAKAIFETYRTAKTRYGTQEEIQLITTVALELREARANLAAVAGETSSPSAAEQQAAEREVSLFQTFVSLEIEDRLGVEGLADVLTTQGFRGIKDKVVSELHQRVRVRAEAELRRLTGLRIRLNVPLKQQIRDFMEGELSRLISKLAVSAGPAGIVISLVAGRILNPGKLVDIAADALKKLLRPKGNVAKRASTSLKGLEELRRALNELRPDTPIDRVRSVVRQAQRELGRTRFLEGDLAREKQDALLAELRGAKDRLERTIKRTRFRFLLDSQLVGENFGIAIAFAAKVRADADRLAKKLGCEPSAGGDGGGGVPPAKGGPPTAATCPPAFTMEYFNVSGVKLGEFAVTGPTLTRVYPNDPYFHKCVYFNPADKGENFVVFISTIPPGIQGRLPSGDCGHTTDSPFASDKRYVTVGGGTRREGNHAVGGDQKIVLQALRLAEAQGVGRACK